MNKPISKQFLILFISSFLLLSCGQNDTQWKGQEPIKKVSTLTKPIQYQLKKTFALENGIFCSNEFDGARLNGVATTGENEITVLITPENTPINSSPWYAFKIWSESQNDIQLKITYNEGTAHRYYPKISSDCKNWNNIDSMHYLADTASISKGESPKFCSMNLSIGPDTLWIAAQELITSKNCNSWSETLSEKPFVIQSEIGRSKEGRAIYSLQIGNPESKKLIMVLSRQHPPEITGWMAMKAFVETLCTETELNKKFRDEYKVLVVPCVNPDGVDNGHWRHGAGGIDLNRDWEDFNQPETQAVKKWMQTQIAEGGKFYFGIDFHSTFQDIYYTINPEKKGNMPGLVPEIINAMGKEIPDYHPNIRPNSDDEPRISSSSFMFYQFAAESLTYEVGDDTPRDLIQQKGELTALKLMELMTR